MLGLMQHAALTVDKIIEHAAKWHPDVEVVTRSVEGPIVRTTYREIRDRAAQVSNALLDCGIVMGDRVATLAWNTARHIETWYGIAGIGAVYHTLNPRLHPDQIAWIINHAEDRVIFADLTFVPILEQILPKCPTVERLVLLTDDSHMPVFSSQAGAGLKALVAYETFIANRPTLCAWGGFDENTACGLCYTSGTTGDPKGVLYSHRSNYLHTLITLQNDVMGISALDTVLPVVPMFHANAWGVAFSAPAVGARIIMPGPKLDGASVHELLESERVTFSAAVPTVWQMLLQHLRATQGKLTTLKRVVIGGSAVPEAIVQAFQEDFGVSVVHAWGMTETSPLGTLATPTAKIAALSPEEQRAFQLKQGRPPIGVELKLTDDEGNIQPHDGVTFGRLKVRGAIVVREYFKGAGGPILDEDGFFDTGDVATIDTYGFMQITDRAKDVIKSGGEWISSIDIENIAVGHPKAELAAVIGIFHPKWDERPLLLVKLKPGETATKEEFLQFLAGKIAKWWTPDDVIFVDDIPLGATGKIDKKLLRQRFAEYQFPATAPVASPGPAKTLAAEVTRPPRLVAPEIPLAKGDGLGHEAAEVIDTTALTPSSSNNEPVEAANMLAWTPVAHPDHQREPQTSAVAPDEMATLVMPDPAAMPRPDAPSYGPRDTADDIWTVTHPAEPQPLAYSPTDTEPAKASPMANGYLTLNTLIGLVPALLIAGGAIGVKLGLIDWKLGFLAVFVQGPVAGLGWAPAIAVLALALSVLGFIVAALGGWRRLWRRASLALGVSLATLGGLAIMAGSAAALPPLHDVSTDWNLPIKFSPETMAARALGGAVNPVEADPTTPGGYGPMGGRRVADLNNQYCPGAKPVFLNLTPDAALDKARQSLMAGGLEISGVHQQQIEAVATSSLYRFKDDIAMRITAAPGGARVDIRSVSRIGVSDLGANCKRVTALVSAMQK